MSKVKMFNSENAPAAIGPYSHSVILGDVIYVSGQLPVNPKNGEVSQDVCEQAKQSLENCKTILENAGSSLNNVAKATIFIKNMNDFGEINEVYGEYFSEHKPARACVEVARLPKDVLVEIEMIASLKL
ncbi:RidA family protein [Clostridium sediminicola]|uniref:RidA family protein n=1 Tax=Clostridium sediminicola TaxID=3114879 RepID=UPI0031F1FEAE